jgi:chromosome segregation and condensation protein ScpB
LSVQTAQADITTMKPKKLTKAAKEVLAALAQRDNQSFAELAGHNASGSNLKNLVIHGLAKTKEIQGAKTWSITALGRKAEKTGTFKPREVAAA